MAIIIGDLHGNLAMARAFLKYRPTDTHVALGDLVDSRAKSDLDEEMACLDLLLNSPSVLIWGNHDLAYLPEQPWSCYGRFGDMAHREQYQAHRDRFVAAVAVDGWLLSHGGVSPRLAKLMPTEVLAGGAERIAIWLNNQFAQQFRARIPKAPTRYGYGPLFQVPVCRGGCDEFGGIFWFDAAGEQTQPASVVGRQIFGHSPVRFPERGNSYELRDGEIRKGPEWINLDANGGGWIYDTVADEIIDLKTREHHFGQTQYADP
jgi:hypothetical protein